MWLRPRPCTPTHATRTVSFGLARARRPSAAPAERADPRKYRRFIPPSISARDWGRKVGRHLGRAWLLMPLTCSGLDETDLILDEQIRDERIRGTRADQGVRPTINAALRLRENERHWVDNLPHKSRAAGECGAGWSGEEGILSADRQGCGTAAEGLASWADGSFSGGDGFVSGVG
jgi:hypothetical protein